MLNSIEVNAEDLSVLAATLANGGVCPLTGERVFKPSTVRSVLSLMSSCGMYDYSGEWFFAIGVPAKSAAVGTIMIVIPNLLGICTYSPRLDKYNLSVRGVEFSKLMTARFAFHTYDKVVRAQHIDPSLYHGTNEEVQIAQLCSAAVAGDLAELRRILALGVDVNGSDYDGRTPLHLAVTELQLKAVHLLILCGADVNRKDKWGVSSLDEAKNHKNKEVGQALEKAIRLKLGNKSTIN